ncbi:hypothetical protein [Corynebacterium sp.]|uniref:hypothetical protein n=1 Tax=Corynebacterium sp. TaxID=1720 RepID=UPI0026DBD3D5|nr:hypothetical protein [Corynebacterium sp.]MDO5031428.1 hypothetical protein [Corynebacterium sp.]
MSIIVSTYYRVSGVKNDRDVRKSLQALYDIFAAHGLGQATFEITDDEHARLVVKHKEDVDPSIPAMNEALAKAGSYEILERLEPVAAHVR